MTPFAFAHGTDWRKCADGLGRPGRGLGFVYFTDALVGGKKALERRGAAFRGSACRPGRP